ncbi:outer membrane beta-barrel protein [Flavobacterium sp.]|uniref:outer membrane beta-barrel protein n=1 Tax=Flavobacterium sp. TaxID=239 RepID=UPI00262C5A1B|nr:outer membrane beta-barrel protein [Flavobacterium sp.]
MSDRKNIDRLFQEKFKDFEAQPSDQVWKNIEASLSKNKKDRKVIPFWWRLSGVAAALVIGLLATNYFFNPESPAQQVVTNDKTPSGKIVPDNDGGVVSKSNDKHDVNPDKTGDTNNSDPANPISIKNKSVAVPEQSVASQALSPALKQKPSSAAVKTIVDSKGHNAVASNPKKSSEKQNGKNTNRTGSENNTVANSGKNHPIPSKIKSPKTIRTEAMDRVASSGNNQLGNRKNTTSTAFNKTGNIAASGTSKINNSPNNDKLAGVNRNSPDGNSNTPNTLAENNIATNPKSDATQKQEQHLLDNTNTIQNIKYNANGMQLASDTKSKTTEIPAAEKKLDSAAIATVETNELEKLLAKNEKEKNVAESKLNRWQVTSAVAPIYFSSTSKGSPIDKQFASNDKSYENNVSFGVGVNYAVNNKLSIRTGVNKLSLGYDTNGVIFYAGLDGQSISNVSQQGNEAFIEVVNKDGLNGLLPFETNLQDLNYGSISQRMGYIEVPMEMSYKLVDKQFGVTLIGGMSTLFLNENEIRVTSNTMKADLGKASNLNDVHFSSNIGMGFNYRFLKSFEFNFEPMFKYQLNTFSKDAGNFKPYFIGLYSGVSFKF